MGGSFFSVHRDPTAGLSAGLEQGWKELCTQGVQRGDTQGRRSLKGHCGDRVAIIEHGSRQSIVQVLWPSTVITVNSPVSHVRAQSLGRHTDLTMSRRCARPSNNLMI